MDLVGQNILANLEKLPQIPADKVIKTGALLVAPIIVDQMARRAGIMVPSQSKLSQYYQKSFGIHSKQFSLPRLQPSLTPVASKMLRPAPQPHKQLLQGMANTHLKTVQIPRTVTAARQ